MCRHLWCWFRDDMMRHWFRCAHCSKEAARSWHEPALPRQS